MKENLQQSLKKIKILVDRVDQLKKVKRQADAIVKAKKLFHLSTSFVSINTHLLIILETIDGHFAPKWEPWAFPRATGSLASILGHTHEAALKLFV